jgi:hypothetical protein
MAASTGNLAVSTGNMAVRAAALGGMDAAVTSPPATPEVWSLR